MPFGDTSSAGLPPARRHFTCRVLRIALASVASAASVTVGAGEAADRMTFRTGCDAGDRITVAAVGDLLFHNALQRQALVKGSSYRQFWNGLEPLLAVADLTYGNLEGPVAEGISSLGRSVRDPGRRWDGDVYGAARGALNFNYHRSLVGDLVTSGFDVVSTANNHAADRGALGLDRTVEALQSGGLAFTGTRARDAYSDARWTVKTRAKGMTVAWIACTYSTNGMPDRHKQALNCYTQREKVLEEIRWNAADPDVDAVILTPHWGIEKAPTPLKTDRDYARAAIEAGATAVVGTHPHVLQGWEKVRAPDGRDGLVIYSTGNFISNQVSDDQRTGIVALIELTRPAAGGKAEVSAAGFVPTWVERGKASVGEMRIDRSRGARAYPAPLKRLPTGNHVTATGFRELPRDCPVTASAERG
ncbi:MAG: CapA family protein [Hyphomicrobiaceae bacterium]|nr:CapA family protein [Hyphomicrobiaceae bacterium]